MPVIETHRLAQHERLPAHDEHQVYCALDSMLTLEIWQELRRTHNEVPAIYSFERALQAPYLEIMQRGFAVDELGRRQAVETLRTRMARVQQVLNELGYALWDKAVNPRSPAQLKQVFYEVLGLPEVWLSQKGERKLSTNREALEKLEVYLYARPLVSCVLTIRDIAKQLEVLETEIDSDGRFRTSYNIAGTETGRPSSSTNAFGTGGNAQNISPALRYAFIADPGKKLVVIDLEQVEARDVGFFCGSLLGDWSYLDSCECLTADHEVLTMNGWVSIAAKPDEIAIWKFGEIRFEQPAKWNEGKVDYLIGIDNRAISVLGTAKHVMPVEPRWDGCIEKRTLAEILRSPNFAAPNTGIYKQGIVNVREAALIAAFQADGTRDQTGKVHWTFSKHRKIVEMESLLDSLGYAYSRYTLGAGTTRFYLKVGQGQDDWPKHCGPEILTWNEETLNLFCKSHYCWDASIEGNNVRIVSKTKQHLEWLAVAYTLIGKAVTINKHKQDYWIINIRTNTRHQYRSSNMREFRMNAEPVYCPTVSSGFFLVKRNGKIFISGNSGDLHSNNAKLVWPELGWTGDKVKDRAIADKQFYRDFTYRDMAKRGSHLSNYRGSAWMMSRALKIPIEVAEEFQARYCRGRGDERGKLAIEPAFQCIVEFWQWIATELQTTGQLVTPFGRRRHFFGRHGDDTTIREAIAFLPQSTTADRMNLGMWRVWHGMPEVELLAQTYDSITFQVAEGPGFDEAVGRALELIRVELRSACGRSYIVPGEAKVGWNWGAQVTSADAARAVAQGKKPPRLNLEGLVKWKPGADKRSRVSGFKRVMT